jgi:hypothetical protein
MRQGSFCRTWRLVSDSRDIYRLLRSLVQAARKVRGGRNLIVAVEWQIYIDREFSAVGLATRRAEASSPGLLSCLICV